jgi:hypothetical protein
MKSILSIILVIIFLNINLLSMAQGNSYDERYAFTSFFDSFDGTRYSTENWTPQNNYGRGSEILINSDSTIRVQNGTLQLWMLKNFDNYPFAGGELISNRFFSYGIFECAANFAIERGSWAAFWLFGGGGEIDIAEERWVDSNNLFIGNYVHEWSGAHNIFIIDEKPVYSRGDYIYKCVWTPTEIKFYRNGILTGTYTSVPSNFMPTNPQQIYLSQQVKSDENAFGPFVGRQFSNFYSVKYKEFFNGPVITCPTIICNNTAATLSVDSRATNISWSLSPANKFYTANGTGNSLTISPRYTSFAGTLTFSFNIGPYNESFTVNQNFWIGKPVKPSAITFVPSTPVTNQLVIGLVSSSNPEISNVHYNWRNTHTYIDQNSTGSEVHFQTIDGPLGYTTPVYVSASNTCGTSAELSKLLTVKKGSGGGAAAGAKITPNPTSSEVEIEITEMEAPEGENTNSAIAADVDYNVLIVDSDGITKYKGKIKDKHLKLNVSGWKRGVYNVLISNGQNTISEKFIVEN